MNLTVKATKDAPIIIDGVGVELESVCVGIEFLGGMDAVSMKITYGTYANEDQMKKGQPLFTNIPQAVFEVRLEKGEIQDRPTAIRYAMEAFERMGYEVEGPGSLKVVKKPTRGRGTN